MPAKRTGVEWPGRATHRSLAPPGGGSIVPHRLLSRLLGLAVLLAAPSLVVPHGLTLAPTTAIAQGTPANDAPLVPPATRCPAPAGYSVTGITVGLEATFAPAGMVSYGLPVPASTVSDASALKMSARGEPVPATVAVLLDEHDADGAPVGVRSVLVQI